LLGVSAVAAFLGAGALGVVGGRQVSIDAVPWTVLVRENGYADCTGVIISPVAVLTAGHCLYGPSAPASHFTVEAGVSNFNDPSSDDHPQIRRVKATHVMPGYIPAKRRLLANEDDSTAHDLAILILDRPLNLAGPDAHAARLPAPNAPLPPPTSSLMLAGFGFEQASQTEANGNLNALIDPTIDRGCSTRGALCAWSTTSATCFGDSGAGLVEPGTHPILLGIVIDISENCTPGNTRNLAPSSVYPDGYIFLGGYVYLGSGAARQFIADVTGG
jgi:secreted trypsin-like serine protease